MIIKTAEGCVGLVAIPPAVTNPSIGTVYRRFVVIIIQQIRLKLQNLDEICSISEYGQQLVLYV